MNSEHYQSFIFLHSCKVVAVKVLNAQRTLGILLCDWYSLAGTYITKMDSPKESLSA